MRTITIQPEPDYKVQRKLSNRPKFTASLAPHALDNRLDRSGRINSSRPDYWSNRFVSTFPNVGNLRSSHLRKEGTSCFGCTVGLSGSAGPDRLREKGKGRLTSLILEGRDMLVTVWGTLPKPTIVTHTKRRRGRIRGPEGYDCILYRRLTPGRTTSHHHPFYSSENPNPTIYIPMFVPLQLDIHLGDDFHAGIPRLDVFRG
jgi:hypothetical protein